MTHPKIADLEALLDALQGGHVEFIIVGGVAAVLHGAPVTTQDLDIVHRRTEDNIDRLLTVLESLDAVARPARPGIAMRPTRETLLGPGQLNLSTRFGPLDPLGSLHDGKGYEELAETAVEIGGQGLCVKVIDLETLIAIKSSTGRTKDKMTVPMLMALRDKTHIA